MNENVILWGACSASAGVAVFFVKIWINRLGEDIEKLDEKLEKKLDALLCQERMDGNRDNCRNVVTQNMTDHREIFDRLRSLEVAK